MKIRKHILPVSSVLVLAGCAPIYLPPAAHSPLLKTKREAQVGLYGGTHGMDVQGAYALTNHVAIMGSASLAYAGQNANRHAYGEAGLGLFNASAISRTSVFAGTGYGYAIGQTAWNQSGNIFEGLATARYLRPFAQGTLAFHTAIFDMGITPRVAMIRMEYLQANAEALPGKVWSTYFEPVGFMGMGLGTVKLKWQLGFSVPMSAETHVSHKSFIFSMGMHVRLRPHKSGS
jgi:hypothetical protein